MFIRAIVAQYHAIESSGVKVTFSHEDPYQTSGELFADIGRGKMRVYDLADMPVDHPMLRTVDGVCVNNMFRAVHDFYAHYGADARAEKYRFDVGMLAGDFGEERAFQRHRAMLLPSAWLALANETRMQAAANNLIMKEGEYVEQKAALLPAWAFAS